MRLFPCLFAAAFFASLARAGTAAVQRSGYTLDKLRAERRALSRRRRRIVFNNDGDDAVYYNPAGTPQGMLAARTLPLAGSQVDSIFYSTSSCFPCFTHRTRIGEIFTCREKGFRNNSVPALLAAGTDPLEIMVRYCRKHQIEIFWSMRMNDTHDSSTAWYGPLLLPKFKKEHPEFLVGSAGKRPPHGPWTAVDYGRREVRDLCFRLIEEVCANYDVDGIELDFFRHPCFFRSVAWGGHAGPKEWRAMTGLLRRIRAMTERRGLARGRPILLAVRVPDSVGYCRGIGLDVEQWLAQGLVDILTTTGYFRLNPWRTSVDLGHRYGVPVLACLSESRVRGQVRPFRRNSLETYRGRALRAWRAGVDGIYMFNYFNPRAALWRQVGSPALLARLPKYYFITNRDGNPTHYLADGQRFQTVPALTPGHPAAIEPGKVRNYDLVIGDDVPARLRRGRAPRLRLFLLAVPARAAGVRLNGARLSPGGSNGAWTEYAVNPGILNPRVQRLSIAAVAGTRKPSNVAWTGPAPPRFPWIRVSGTARKHLSAQRRNDALLIADRGTESGSYLFFQYPWQVRPGQAARVDAAVQVLSGWSSIDVADGAHEEEIQLFPGKIRARFLRIEHPVKLTGAFHHIRVVLENRFLRVAVDGQPALAGKLTHAAYSGRSIVAFGAANSPSRGEALWKSVCFPLPAPGLTLFDAVLALDPPPPGPNRPQAKPPAKAP